MPKPNKYGPQRPAPKLRGEIIPRSRRPERSNKIRIKYRATKRHYVKGTPHCKKGRTSLRWCPHGAPNPIRALNTHGVRKARERAREGDRVAINALDEWQQQVNTRRERAQITADLAQTRTVHAPERLRILLGFGPDGSEGVSV